MAGCLQRRMDRSHCSLIRQKYINNSTVQDYDSVLKEPRRTLFVWI